MKPRKFIIKTVSLLEQLAAVMPELPQGEWSRSVELHSLSEAEVNTLALCYAKGITIVVPMALKVVLTNAEKSAKVKHLCTLLLKNAKDLEI